MPGHAGQLLSMINHDELCKTLVINAGWTILVYSRPCWTTIVHAVTFWIMQNHCHAGWDMLVPARTCWTILVRGVPFWDMQGHAGHAGWDKLVCARPCWTTLVHAVPFSVIQGHGHAGWAMLAHAGPTHYRDLISSNGCCTAEFYCLVSHQGILKGEVSLYCLPPVWLVWITLFCN